MFRALGALTVVMVCAASAHAAQITHSGTTVAMDFVTVGNAGNAPDTEVMNDGTTGYGAVGYNYRLGTYAVSKNQWDTVVGADAGDLLDDPGYWSGNRPMTQISCPTRPCLPTD